MFKNGLNAWRSLIGANSASLPRAMAGVSLIAMSVLALAAPLATGKWSLQLMALFPFLVGLTELYSAVRSPDLRSRPASYVTGFLAIAAAMLLFVSPALVIEGVVALLLGFFVIDSALKLGQAVLGRDTPSPRVLTAVNGTSSLLLAVLGWALWQKVSIERCLAGLDRDIVGNVRLQPRAVLPELHGDPRRALEGARCLTSARCQRSGALARLACVFRWAARRPTGRAG